MSLDTLKDLYLHELQDLYSAEDQLTEALPKMADAASSSELEKAFRDHLKETEGHRSKVASLLQSHGEEPGEETCDGMKGLIEEGEEILEKDGDPAVQDAALIGAAQRVEHYEMAGYGTARAFARALGFDEEVKTLDDILEQEGDADRTLGEIAEETVNPKAAKAG